MGEERAVLEASFLTTSASSCATGCIDDTCDDVIERLGYLVEAPTNRHPSCTANAVASEVGLVKSIPRWGWDA